MHHILLVDDDADVRRMVKKILEKGGYQVSVVDNGLSALDELNSRTYDLLVSDANMPQYSGFDLIKALRRQPRHRELCIAMLTGRREKQDIQLAIDLGVNDYIVKPIDPDVLLNKIEKILAHKKKDVGVLNFEQSAMVDFAASLQSPIQMATIGLSGFTAVSTVPISIGAEFYLCIDELEYENMPKVRVTSSAAHPINTKQYVLHGQFLEIDEEFKNQIKICLSKARAA